MRRAQAAVATEPRTMIATMVGSSSSPVAVSEPPITPRAIIVAIVGPAAAPAKPLLSPVTTQAAAVPNRISPMPCDR